MKRDLSFEFMNAITRAYNNYCIYLNFQNDWDLSTDWESDRLGYIYFIQGKTQNELLTLIANWLFDEGV